MFPLVAIGGVIGAVMSVAKGVSWLSEQLGSSENSASVGGKSDAAPLSGAQVASFQATLAAQAAGQGVPAVAPSAIPAAPATLIPEMHSVNYDAAARMKAGVVAYSHIGEHHGNHAGAIRSGNIDDNTAVAQS